MAATVDGKIDTVERTGARISSPEDDERVDALRAASDAVMVGGRTLLAEDPRLLVRSERVRRERLGRRRGPSPAKVGIVSVVPPDWFDAWTRGRSRFVHDGPADVIIFTTDRTELAVRGRLEEEGVEVIVAGSERVDLPEALANLARRGVERLLVEGGGTLVADLLEHRLVDEFHLFVAPMIFGGRDAPTPVDGPGFRFPDAIRLTLLDVSRVEAGGIVVRYHVETAPSPSAAPTEPEGTRA